VALNSLGLLVAEDPSGRWHWKSGGTTVMLMSSATTPASGNASTGWWFGSIFIIPCIDCIGITIPTDELIFFRGVGQPPSSSNVNVLVLAFGFDCPSLSDLSGPLSYLFLFSSRKPCGMRIFGDIQRWQMMRGNEVTEHVSEYVWPN